MATSPREKRQAQTRQEILDAALAIIAEQGPDALSLRGLARRVQYSPAGLYEYFDGKDAIIEAVCADGDQRLRSYLEQVPLGLPPGDYLVALGQAYIRFALQNEAHFTLMFARMPDGPSFTHADLDADGTYAILLNAVQTAVDQELITVAVEPDAHAIAYGLWSLAHGLAVMQLTNLRNMDYDFWPADRLALETYVRGLLR
jgi:AcrR family transcriptional regulator